MVIGLRKLIRVPIQPRKAHLDRSALLRGDVAVEPFEGLRSRPPVAGVLKRFAERDVSVERVGRDRDHRLGVGGFIGEKPARDAAERSSSFAVEVSLGEVQ